RAPVQAGAIACLDRSRGELGTLLELLAETGADPQRIARAITRLSAPQSCIDAEPLHPESDPALVERVHQAFRRAETLLYLGERDRAIAAADAIVVAAATGDAALRSYAQGHAAVILRHAGQIERARDAFERAYYLALEGDAHAYA